MKRAAARSLYAFPS